jgi:hypothetical protein
MQVGANGTGATTGTSSSSTTAAPTTWTTDLYAALVLHDAGFPITANNIANLTAWFRAESGGNMFANGSTGNWLRDNNPLNINSTWEGATLQTHSWGNVYAYSTPQAGARATADFITKNSNDSGVAQALASNAPGQILGQAISTSSWASGNYGGANPITSSGSWFADANGNATSPIAAPNGVSTVGFWQDFLKNLGTPGVGGVGGAIPGASSASSALSGVNAIGSFFSGLTDPAKLKRAGILVGGLAIMVASGFIFFASTDTGKQISTTAGKAALL